MGTVQAQIFTAEKCVCTASIPLICSWTSDAAHLRVQQPTPQTQTQGSCRQTGSGTRDETRSTSAVVLRIQPLQEGVTACSPGPCFGKRREQTDLLQTSEVMVKSVTRRAPLMQRDDVPERTPRTVGALDGESGAIAAHDTRGADRLHVPGMPAVTALF